jgi:hypothetical protein
LCQKFSENERKSEGKVWRILLRKHRHNPTAARSGPTLPSQSSRSWTTTTLFIPRDDLAATSSQNLVFFGGGWAGIKLIIFNRVDIYNTLNGSWSTATSVNFVLILRLEILFFLEIVRVSVAYFSNIFVFNVTGNYNFESSSFSSCSNISW